MTLLASPVSQSQQAGLPDYVPGTNLPQLDSEQTLEFELGWNRFRQCETWQAIIDVPEGSTIYAVNDNSEHFPSNETKKWRVRIYRVLRDTPSKSNSTLYHRIILVNLITPVSMKTKPQPAPKPAPKQAEPSKAQPVVATPKRVLNGICFMETGQDLTFTFQYGDGVVEEFILECGEDERPDLVRLKGADGTRFTNPLRVEVTREIDIRPKFRKYAVRRR